MDKLKEISDETVDLVMTSPPYLWVRDYGWEGQWGLENTMDEYLDKMIAFTHELKRVTKKTGSIVINMGDVYGGGTVHSNWNAPENNNYAKLFYSDKRLSKMKFSTNIRKPYPNSLLFIPFQYGWRCVREVGLTCHNIIPWIKHNPMPFSGRNRFMNTYEPIFWFTKKPSGYFFDLNSVRTIANAFFEKPRRKKDTKGQTKLIDGSEQTEIKKQDSTPTASGVPDPTKVGFNERWKNKITSKYPENYDPNTGEYVGHPNGKNPGDVIYTSTQPYPDAHYATFPEKIPEYFIKCMCPVGGMVLDPFAGSGTTAMVAERLARQWVMIEGFKDNAELIQKRIDPYLNEKL